MIWSQKNNSEDVYGEERFRKVSIGLQHASDAGMCKLYHENSWYELDIV